MSYISLTVAVLPTEVIVFIYIRGLALLSAGHGIDL